MKCQSACAIMCINIDFMACDYFVLDYETIVEGEDILIPNQDRNQVMTFIMLRFCKQQLQHSNLAFSLINPGNTQTIVFFKYGAPESRANSNINKGTISLHYLLVQFVPTFLRTLWACWTFAHRTIAHDWYFIDLLRLYFSFPVF